MSRTFTNQVPLVLDVGWKFSKNILLGAYFGAGFGGVGSDLTTTCSMSGVSCSTTSYRVGAQIQYHIIPAGKFNPWFGVGAGFEFQTLSAKGPGGDVSVTAGGFEFPRLSGGLDVRLSRDFGVGPVVDFAPGQFQAISVTTKGVSKSNDLSSKAFHSWLGFGVRLVIFP